MAININDKPNVTPPGGDFEFAKIKDETTPGANDGVPLNDIVYGDFHQFFAKIVEQSGIAYNGLQENLTNGYQYLEALKKLFVQTDPGNQLKTKVIEIGDWDMDATPNINVAHGVVAANIRTVFVMISNDEAPLFYFDLSKANSSGVVDGFFQIDVNTGTDIFLERRTGGSFDSTSFNATPFNRGWITIVYEA
jgi:hypothetical protein